MSSNDSGYDILNLIMVLVYLESLKDIYYAHEINKINRSNK